ncbi:substrate-binding domain-containing protein [Rhizobium sp. S95]|uniref:Substrate-binding domain-containing protein n=1 Tax=Ciceribacter sichuanensis TaxID=2949647 RepID=A0AAJ1BTA9_9HYPH|nr:MULTISPECIES: substrate-binding domain-containing protein [unclassified Ciceribacter]MCM2394990.1 substrate-binding domain-containing protein [Ciceribacter sp. S95]MCO5955412.1 substrate-binding domain-containing protein [Ciceribacter sp. S101]
MHKTSLLALTLLLTAGTASAQTIGVSMSSLDKFKTVLLNGILAHGKTVPGLKIISENAEGDTAKQLEQMRKFVADKVDAIIVAPSDGDLGPQMSKIASDAGIPLIYVNNEPSNLAELPEKQAVVASDEKDSGTLETREVCRLLNGKGKAVVMMGELFHAAARKRTEDVSDVLSTDTCKGIQIVERQSANWSRDQADSLMQEWLKAGVKFDAVITNNDEMALGAIRAMKNAGISMDTVVVAGVDATDDALAAMVAGDLDVTILQNATGQGKGAIEAALKLIKGDKVEKTNYVPFELVTPANVATYLPKSL